jgi:hypothetical protein
VSGPAPEEALAMKGHAVYMVAACLYMLRRWFARFECWIFLMFHMNGLLGSFGKALEGNAGSHQGCHAQVT